MSERANFVRHIAAHPDDEDARAAYADWLEERGDATQAEFIRVQCQLAREYPDEVAGRAGDAMLRSAGGTYWNLRKREHELWNRYWASWFKEDHFSVGRIDSLSAAQHLGCAGFVGFPDRGLISTLHCRFDQWVVDCQANSINDVGIRDRHPIRFVKFQSRPLVRLGYGPDTAALIHSLKPDKFGPFHPITRREWATTSHRTPDGVKDELRTALLQADYPGIEFSWQPSFADLRNTEERTRAARSRLT